MDQHLARGDSFYQSGSPVAEIRREVHLSGTADGCGPGNSHGGSGADRRTQEKERVGRD